LLLCGALLLLGGCASRWQDMFVSYSDQMVPLRNQLLLGHAADSCLQWVDNQAEYRLRHGLDQVSSQLTNDQSMAYLPPRLLMTKMRSVTIRLTKSPWLRILEGLRKHT
ncbi:hypothetical protein DV708_22945, partial [Aeromonas veronii]